MSNWNPLATIQLTEDWQYTTVTTDNVFKFAFTDSFNISSVGIAQAQVGSVVQLFDFRRLAVRSENEILTIEPPPFFEERRIAIRAIAFSDKKPVQLTLSLESLSMPIQNPVNVNVSVPQSVYASTAVTKYTIAAEGRDSAPANPDRKGVLIRNKGTGYVSVYMGQDSNTAPSGSFVLQPGGTYELYVPFTPRIDFYSDDGTEVVVTDLLSEAVPT